MVDPQCSAESKPHESIHDSIQYLFTERDIENLPVLPKDYDITERVKVDVADFSRRLDAKASVD